MSQPLPLDPMYTRFRERHPEVTLVLLPGGADALGEPVAPATPRDAEAAEHELTQARDDVGMHLTDVCAALDVEGRIEVHWRSGEQRGTATATATAYAPIEISPEDALRRLSALGWRSRFISRAPVPSLGGTLGTFVLRVVIHDGGALITLRSAPVVVGPRRAVELVGHDGDA